ncbi:MAG: 4Fe-4S cluster-binding domain-containing protein [Lentisphaeria bacterium]|nr:4Fe-4S cluster-binding domain-containing protein [Lentisphaeria bacterium]
MTLRIYETFASIQGESTRAGIPCFFIRLAQCNLRCSYCDTKRAQTLQNSREAALEELVEAAEQSGLDLVEITGGEPMLQADAVCELSQQLIRNGHTVMIETNGSCDLSVLPPEVIRIVDWKTPSSGESEKMFLPNFNLLRPIDEVKFVLSDENDYRFALEKIREFRLAEQTPNLLFSPVYGALAGADLVRWMLRDHAPARLNLQIHKYIWDPAREGV